MFTRGLGIDVFEKLKQVYEKANVDRGKVKIFVAKQAEGKEQKK